jgi:hypothetical protein
MSLPNSQASEKEGLPLYNLLDSALAATSFN